MDYIVWKKEEYGDNWSRIDCGDEPALQRTILELLKTPGEVEVTVPIEYQVKVSLSKAPADIVPKLVSKRQQIKLAPSKEVKVETAQGGPKENQDPGS